MSNSYNTQDTELFSSTNVLTGIGTKYFFYSSPFYHNKHKCAKYEMMTSYFVIFERFYQFFNRNDIPML